MAKNINLINKVNLSFELKCLGLLIQSFSSVIKENLLTIEWEEESISAHIVQHLRNLKSDFIINYEVPLVEKDIYNAIKKVKNSNRIDIFFQKNQWRKVEYLEYHVEAKNISSVEWRKSTGTKVNASQQQTEYITKGIERFLTGHFKDKNGCMLAYIVNGKLDDLLLKINNKIELQKSNLEIISFKEQLINNHRIYESCHSQRNIKHLFFDYLN
ncbi:hypothetical protein ASU31_15600 [Pedobacter ginsenosidimutans]|uniref:Uncharacterized protein n=1 Tax=Pedobacter ginsenosidimutans TaxID=687842 RepID=A0A0T5VMK5_9SPHI|nr:hypothetical protein [Pedobacter ginsenosidimutans]KRT15102.1 hypothetical protein ASU31_15600 [Pedobacter ginsenosidimutans]